MSAEWIASAISKLTSPPAIQLDRLSIRIVKTPLLVGEFLFIEHYNATVLESKMKFPAWYGILVGCLMIAQWGFSIVSGGVPEFKTAPWEIAFHLAAEMSTALMLIVGGIAALKSVRWAEQVLLIGLGMVMYSEIVSPGYFAQLGQWALVAMFAFLLFGAAWSATLLLSWKERRTHP